MSGPAWLNNIFAALMLGVAGYALVRVILAARRRRATRYDVDVAHVPMGLAMAGMFAPRLNILPWWAWGILFGLLTGYFLVRTLVRGTRERYLPHTAHSGAMLYMVLAAPVLVGPAADGNPRLPTVALVLMLYMVGYTVLLTQRLASDVGLPTGTGEGTAEFAPFGADLYKIVTSVGMGFMLILLL